MKERKNNTVIIILLLIIIVLLIARCAPEQDASIGKGVVFEPNSTAQAQGSVGTNMAEIAIPGWDVSLELDSSMESYTLTIPATVELDPSTKTGYIGVELKDVNLVWSGSVNVSFTAANGETGNAGSYLVNTENEDLKIHYTITNFAGDEYTHNPEKPMSAVYSYKENGEDKVMGGQISFAIDGEYPGAGTYTDTLTFNVKLS